MARGAEEIIGSVAGEDLYPLSCGVGRYREEGAPDLIPFHLFISYFDQILSSTLFGCW